MKCACLAVEWSCQQLSLQPISTIWALQGGLRQGSQYNADPDPKPQAPEHESVLISGLPFRPKEFSVDGSGLRNKSLGSGYFKVEFSRFRVSSMSV